VIATRDRRASRLRTLDQLTGLPERPPVIVVDNGSVDGSPAAVRAAHPNIDVVTLGRNIGAPARNVGARRAATPYVAFADDDSWWAPGSLARAEELLDRHPHLAVVAARVAVGEEAVLDPTSAAMAASPLASQRDGPGPSVLGFLACGAVVRRDAFLAVGGFDDLLFFLGEEALVAIDLAEAGWELRYVADVVAHHHPGSTADRPGRRRRAARNALLVDWLRRPVPVAARRTGTLAWEARHDAEARGALVEAAARLPAAMRRRRRVRPPTEAQLRLLDAE
jgi:GT2 family glycosyltransferase